MIEITDKDGYRYCIDQNKIRSIRELEDVEYDSTKIK